MYPQLAGTGTTTITSRYIIRLIGKTTEHILTHFIGSTYLKIWFSES
jgi:hypothetical protein